MTDSGTGTGKSIGSLDRGLAILRYLTSAHEAPIAEIATATELTRSTAYRLADRLREWGFLENGHGTGRWRLGPEAARLGLTAVQQTDVTHVAPELLRLLVQQTRETVGLAVFNRDEMIFVHREPGPQAVTVSTELGSRRPLYCTSVGKAYLAALPQAERRTLLRKLTLTAHTPHTIVTHAEVERDIELTRQRGWSEDHKEFDGASTCCGAAIFNHTGKPVAAISVAGLAERVNPQVERVGPIVASTADAISGRLGYVTA